jgi:hypothetical protein
MTYFNPSLHTQVIVDASPVGLGAILVQLSFFFAHKYKVEISIQTKTPVYPVTGSSLMKLIAVQRSLLITTICLKRGTL